MKRTMLRTCSSVALLAGCAVMLTACKSDDHSTTSPSTQASMHSSDTVAMGAINDTCPMSAHPVDPNLTVTTANGKKVAFCGGACVEGWHNMSKSEQMAYVDKHSH